MTVLLRRCLVALIGLLAALLTLVAHGAECLPTFVPPTEAALSAAAAQARDRGFLWKIRKGRHTSYLYGTMHLGKLEWWAPGPTVTSAIRRSRLMALELDLSDNLTASRLMQGMMAQDDDLPLPRKSSARLRRHAEAECLDWSGLQGLRHEFQLSTVLVASARRHGLESAYGAETMLTALAHKENKPVVALETVEEQIKALRAAHPAELEELIDSGLNDLETGVAQRVLVKLAAAWAHRDAQILQSYEQWCGCMESAAERALSRRVIDERNMVLAARVDALHGARGGVFAAVGALHMFGASGLPQLMKSRGYTVERVF